MSEKFLCLFANTHIQKRTYILNFLYNDLLSILEKINVILQYT